MGAALADAKAQMYPYVYNDFFCKYVAIHTDTHMYGRILRIRVQCANASTTSAVAQNHKVAIKIGAMADRIPGGGKLASKWTNR